MFSLPWSSCSAAAVLLTCHRGVAVIFGCWRRHEMVLPATLLLLVIVAVAADRCFSFSSSCRVVDVLCGDERVAHTPVDGQEGPPDVCVIELGGTIGDIESMPFMEALGQFPYRVVLNVVGEQKTKPTQHSVRGLRGLGLTSRYFSLSQHIAISSSLSFFMHVFNCFPATSN
ncbi:hypothetical protein BVRB_3g070030 [Beta vulgaris subsp. vulgaris]|nr:hypothetical protein BVRB_3g070030 [Beta vulgaris subsp. vulgaris]